MDESRSKRHPKVIIFERIPKNNHQDTKDTKEYKNAETANGR